MTLKRGSRIGRILLSFVVVATAIPAFVGSDIASATATPSLFYSWGQGTNTVSKMNGTTPTDTWASGSTGSGAATGVATDGTYVYWANGTRVFRQLLNASAGQTVTAFFDITGWAGDAFGNHTIRALASDGTYLYVVGNRGYDDSSVYRALLSNGTRDSSWRWTFNAVGTREAWGITASSTYVFLAWGNNIARATTAATSGQPTTVELTWASYNQPIGSSTVPRPMTNDGTHIYFGASFQTILRRAMNAAPNSPQNIDLTQVSLGLPAGSIVGLSYGASTGLLYAVSSNNIANTYTIYTVLPDAVNPSAFTTYATFTSTTMSVNSLVATDIPASTPTITSQPANTTKTVGDSLSLSVTATAPDSGTLSYQWRKDGVSIAGATSSTLTIGSLSSTDAGNYSVVVTNTLGATTATVTSSAAVLTVNPRPTTTTSSTTTSTTTTTTTVPIGSSSSPTMVTATNRAQLEADPGEATALINGVRVAVETVKVDSATATPADLLETAKEIVSEISKVLPAGATNTVKVVETDDGAELSGLMTNPEDPAEKLNVPVESVTLVKAGNTAVLISALNQTNLPAEIVAGGVMQVTRGGIVAAKAFGLPGSETGEIVLMSTPRLLKTFTVAPNGSYSGQVPLPKDISFGSHTVVMATSKAKVSLGIKLVRTRMQFRIKRSIGTTIFRNRAGVVKNGGGKVTISASGRCRANSRIVKMAARPGACFVTVRQAAKGKNKAIFYRFTVSVVTKAPKKIVKK